MLWLGRCAVLLAMAAISGRASAQAQRVAMPSYFYPGPLWTKLESAAPTLGMAIINPASGPGDKRDPAYAAQTAEARARGVTVIGYVHTSYAKRAFADVAQETKRYFDWYGVDGILFDEVANTKPEIGYYLRCRNAARACSPKAIVVLNPGTQTDEGYMAACDILINFESPYRDYQAHYSAPDWVKRYPARRFWHIVLQTPDEAAMRHVVTESKARNAGWLFITPYGDPNPYDKLPPQPYWEGELAAARGAG